MLGSFEKMLGPTPNTPTLPLPWWVGICLTKPPS